ncbi:MAG: hypothetical protein F8N36_13605 [Desulfovibrio sp.]|uniref:hypothetical protein n=1 Tax=Desulfovibrio sp. TaxID=885 RepID=UPI00135E707F|nr:hypothetical protein [Desulfovibrio sp.]MTJ93875.1 hypothetical protein [Desulfovibrio sp.]
MHKELSKYPKRFLKKIFDVPATAVANAFGFKPFLRPGHVEEFAKFADDGQLLIVSTESSYASAPHAAIWKISRRGDAVLREVDRLTTFYEALLLSNLVPPVEGISTPRISYSDLLETAGVLPEIGSRLELVFTVVRTSFIADAGFKGTVTASKPSLIRLELDKMPGEGGNGPIVIEWYPLSVDGDWFQFWRDTRVLAQPPA